MSPMPPARKGLREDSGKAEPRSPDHVQGLCFGYEESLGYGDDVEGNCYVYSSVCDNLGLILLVVNSII